MKNNNEKRYNKEVFWKKDFDEQARFLLYAMGGIFRLSDHMERDNLSGKRKDFDHDYTMEQIRTAFEKASAGKYYCFEVRTNEHGNVVRACYRVQIDNTTDINLCLWAYGKIEIHTAWKSLVKMRAIRDERINPNEYEKH